MSVQLVLKTPTALAKAERRIHTDADFAMATDVATRMYLELTEIEEERAACKRRLTSLAGQKDDDAQAEEAELTKQFDGLTFRITALRKDLLAWAVNASNVAHKQLETRHKSGELVTVQSALIYVQEMKHIANKYADKRFKAQARRDSAAALQNFIRANPAALLEMGAEVNEAVSRMQQTEETE